MKKQGHYCKVCGQYRANEKFSGKGHSAHICKSCSALSVVERNKQILLTRMENLPWHLSKEDAAWLKKQCGDKRPEVSTLAQMLYHDRFPFAQRNERKRLLHIKHMELRINDEIPDEYGDWQMMDATFTLNKASASLIVSCDGGEKTISLGTRQMTRLLNKIVNNYEVFCWGEDYDLGESLDAEPTWSISICYCNGETQGLVSYEETPDRLFELIDELHTLLE